MKTTEEAIRKLNRRLPATTEHRIITENTYYTRRLLRVYYARKTRRH